MKDLTRVQLDQVPIIGYCFPMQPAHPLHLFRADVNFDQERIMRIVILTDLSERHFYFANRIDTECEGVVGVFLGAKYRRRNVFNEVARLIKRKLLFRTIINKFLNTLFSSSGEKFRLQKCEQENIFFGGSREEFELRKNKFFCKTVCPSVGTINDSYYVDIIKSLAPDVIVVMGSCLISKQIMDIPKYIFNIHTGLSPYYRGGYTNLWPIINEDYGYFGVTIHTMSSGIDAGEIIFTERPNIIPDDNYGSVNAKAIVLGVDLMIAAIELVRNNDLKSLKQWTHGKLFHNHHYNNYFAYLYNKRCETFMSNYCDHKKQNTLDKVLLVRNGEIRDF